ncbi:RNA polymerase sigma-70 factor, ECF subfamily [Nannocystis exedens]|uniref:RNA polymerase sigma-70 factor, ECF subfamily n=1 Tax=Nannocystis exedens TaxID=54 RepID=A0A1I1ZZV3_9BACT|nr:sigma-70 family RNA polymerase sigma factor [Nannocystis exedens]PCC75260.1 ECF RNA polymerase sigma-E factor [Nannocystis exedens]SFE36243.1 RNA polymerase sigma-70 factor, ECF subfamily [Nannocystis exedens]
MTETSDEALLHAWIDGDAAAGKQLVTRHYRRILLFFYSKVGPELGRDLTQATFETLCAKKVVFRGESSVLTYLFGIARWKLVHHLRTRRLHDERFEPLEHSVELPEVDRSITSLFMGRQREALLVRALRSLPLDDQIVLELKEYEGMTSRQLAEIYEVGRDTMSSRINRARQRLTVAVQRAAESVQLIDSTLTGLDECMREIRQRLDGAARSAR